MRALRAPEPEYVPAINAPDSFDLSWHLRMANHDLLEHPHYRRAYTRLDPLLFALIYFGESALISAETGPDINLAQFHIDLCESAKQWIRDDIGPAEVRDGWIAARGSGKSHWLFKILLAWALAHEHVKFAFCTAYTDGQARDHLRNLRRALASNELLRYDFPDLCTPVTDKAGEYIAHSGVAVVAAGITSTHLGAVLDSVRPSLIIGDDLEPPEGSHSDVRKETVLSNLINGVFGMNPNAVVQLAGTVTMFGSAAHDLVRAAHGERVEWVAEQNIRTHYYAPILTDPDGTERSYWPARYSMEYLNSIRGSRYFELNFLNMPRSHADGLFEPHHYVIRPAARVDEQVLWVDPGATSHRRSDPTGLAVATRDGQRAVVEYAEGFRLSPGERKDVVGRLCRDNPALRTVVVETNKHGDSVLEELRSAVPPSVHVVGHHTVPSKETRFDRHLEYIQMGWVTHADEFDDLKQQMLGWPKASHDDVLDAAAGACWWLLKDRPRPRPHR